MSTKALANLITADEVFGETQVYPFANEMNGAG
jgi:hypothetical protein